MSVKLGGGIVKSIACGYDESLAVKINNFNFRTGRLKVWDWQNGGAIYNSSFHHKHNHFHQEIDSSFHLLVGKKAKCFFP